MSNPLFNNDSTNNNEPEISQLTPELRLQRNHKIWAVGGGKGGVGKSFITANLSICLALLGHKVITIDLDLGGANLHTCLGSPIPENTLSDYFNKKVNSIEQLVTPTTVPNLSFISGAQDELGMANLKSVHKNRLLQNLVNLDANYILFDLGAGTSANTIDFFLSSDQGILAVLPEPTSIENTYRFIKSVYYRKLRKVEEFLDLHPFINETLNGKIQASTLTPSDMVQKIIEIDPEKGGKLKEEITNFRPKLIMNQVRTQADIDIGFSMKSISKKYFGIELEYIGYLDYDATVWQSVRKRRPLLLEFPDSKLAANFDKITHRLLNFV